MQRTDPAERPRLALHPRDWCPWRTAALGLSVIVVFLLFASPELRTGIAALLALVVGVPLLVEYVTWRRGHAVDQPQPE